MGVCEERLEGGEEDCALRSCLKHSRPLGVALAERKICDLGYRGAKLCGVAFLVLLNKM